MTDNQISKVYLTESFLRYHLYTSILTNVIRSMKYMNVTVRKDVPLDVSSRFKTGRNRIKGTGDPSLRKKNGEMFLRQPRFGSIFEFRTSKGYHSC